MTSITQRQDRVEAGSSVEDRRSGLVFAVWVLSILVVGLAAWLIYDQFFGSDTATTSDIEALLDDYTAAWNEYDGTGFLELVTDDYEFEQAGVSRSTAANQASMIDAGSGIEWQVERVGESLMQGDGPWYVASANNITTSIAPEDGYRGISIFTIVEQDGELLIRRHVYFGRA